MVVASGYQSCKRGCRGSGGRSGSAWLQVWVRRQCQMRAGGNVPDAFLPKCWVCWVSVGSRVSSVVPVAMHLPLFGRLVRQNRKLSLSSSDLTERALAGFAGVAAYRRVTDAVLARIGRNSPSSWRDATLRKR